MHQTLLEVLYVYWDFHGGPVVRTQHFHSIIFQDSSEHLEVKVLVSQLCPIL